MMLNVLKLEEWQGRNLMLNKLLKIIEEAGISSISGAAHELDVSSEMVRVMLDDLQRKGVIKKTETERNVSGCCHNCSKCSAMSKSHNTNEIKFWEIVT